MRRSIEWICSRDSRDMQAMKRASLGISAVCDSDLSAPPDTSASPSKMPPITVVRNFHKNHNKPS